MTRHRRNAQSVPPPDTLSRERTQHDHITREARQIVDDAGGIGLPYRVESWVMRLYRGSVIGKREVRAALRFSRLYRVAFRESLHAMDPANALGGSSRRSGAYVRYGSQEARREVNGILARLGGERGTLQASCAVSVIGMEMSVAEWARSLRWMGKDISEHAAKGVLLATLESLADHFADQMPSGTGVMDQSDVSEKKA